jgi:hypothetical protein
MDELRLAYISEDLVTVKILVHECLNLAAQLKHDQNYSTAIHQAYTLSGLVALKEGNVEEAKSCIINSGLTSGSDELSSKGPNMLLAHELLLLNENDTVLSYLKICKNIWLSKEGVVMIEKWKRSIINGDVPKFGSNMNHHLFL